MHPRFSSKSLKCRPRDGDAGRAGAVTAARVMLLRRKNRNDVRRRLMQAAFRDISGAPTPVPLIASIDRGDATSVIRKTHTRDMPERWKRAWRALYKRLHSQIVHVVHRGPRPRIWDTVEWNIIIPDPGYYASSTANKLSIASRPPPLPPLSLSLSLSRSLARGSGLLRRGQSRAGGE